jgi:ketoreductase RED2
VDNLTGVAIVTGSSSGMGAAIARRLAGAGMTVVVNSNSSVETGQAVAAEIGGSYEQGDVSDEAAADALVGRVLERYDRLDLLVNNAGTTVTIPQADLEAATTEIWRRILDVNILGAWHMSTAAVPYLRASPEGHIVNITSLGGQRPIGSSIPYSVSKAGLDHLTRLLASTLGPEIRVNAIAPGFVDTPWTAGWNEMRDQIASKIPLRRAGQPEDIAEAVIGLHRSTYVTGQILAVDGGYHLR